MGYNGVPWGAMGYERLMDGRWTGQNERKNGVVANSVG